FVIDMSATSPGAVYGTKHALPSILPNPEPPKASFSIFIIDICHQLAWYSLLTLLLPGTFLESIFKGKSGDDMYGRVFFLNSSIRAAFTSSTEADGTAIFSSIRVYTAGTRGASSSARPSDMTFRHPGRSNSHLASSLT